MDGRHLSSFEAWLDTVRGLSAPTIRSRISNCKRVEQYEGDLDSLFDNDGLASLLERLTYSAEDATYGRSPKHKVPINGERSHGDRYTEGRRHPLPRIQELVGTRAWRPSQNASGPPAGRRMAYRVWKLARLGTTDRRDTPQSRSGAHATRSLSQAGDRRRRRRGHATACDRMVDFVSANAALTQQSTCGTARRAYSPAYGVYAGSKEIAEFRRQSPQDAPPPHCLALDDNDYPKHLWAFVFTGKPFRKKGPDGYQLGHLVDHKEHGNRWREELRAVGEDREPPLLFGLFTSAANTAYFPSAFLRPTDFSFHLRSLVQRQAQHLYSDVCLVLPPGLELQTGHLSFLGARKVSMESAHGRNNPCSCVSRVSPKTN